MQSGQAKGAGNVVSRHRRFEPGYIYHVFNRGALRQKLFLCDEDYEGFESLIEDTLQRFPLPIFSYELMPNHWHFVVRPDDKEQLSSFFQQLAGTHGKRFRAKNHSIGEGHVYQDRFKSFPVQCDGHFLCLCRYVERNALRAGLVERAEDWRWSSLYRRLTGTDDWLISDWPVPRPDDWIERVNQPLTDAERAAIRTCISRGRPFGGEQWTQQTAGQLGLQFALERRGRPSVLRQR